MVTTHDIRTFAWCSVLAGLLICRYHEASLTAVSMFTMLLVIP